MSCGFQAPQLMLNYAQYCDDYFKHMHAHTHGHGVLSNIDTIAVIFTDYKLLCIQKGKVLTNQSQKTFSIYIKYFTVLL